jgi:hypothetical protein
MQIFAYDFTPYQARQQYNFRTFSEILLLAVNYMRSPRSVMMVGKTANKNAEHTTKQSDMGFLLNKFPTVKGLTAPRRHMLQVETL